MTVRSLVYGGLIGLLCGAWRGQVSADSPRTAAVGDGMAGESGVAASFTSGMVRAPFYTAAFPEVRSQVARPRLVRLAGHLGAPGSFRLEAQIAGTWSGVMQPAGSYLVESAWSNALLAVAHVGPSWQREAVRTQLILRLGVGIPTANASSQPGYLRQRVLAIANAMALWRDQELFTPGVLSLIPEASLTCSGSRWSLGATLKATAMARVSDARLPPERTRSAAFTPVLRLDTQVTPAGWPALRLAADVAANLPAPVRAVASTQFDLVQVSLSPGVRFGLPTFTHSTIAIDAAIPVSGPLWGTFAVGVLVEAHWFDEP
jgi:hypothetical protein